MRVLLLLTVCLPIYVSAQSVTLQSTAVEYLTTVYEDVRAQSIAIDQSRKLVYVTGGEYINIFKLGANDTLKHLKEQQFVGMKLGQVRQCANFITIIMKNDTDPSMVSLEVYKVYNKKSGNDITSLNSIPLGAGPGSHRHSADCKTVVVPIGNPEYTDSTGMSVDGDGMITIIKFKKNNLADAYDVVNLDFNSFAMDNSRLVGEGALLDSAVGFTTGLEPADICYSSDETGAYVILQPNNIVASVNITTETILSLNGLGLKDWSTGDGFDPNDRDGIQLTNYTIFGAYTPARIECFAADGVEYFLTVNDGLPPYRKQSRLNRLTLDSTVFPDQSFQDNSEAGRLNVWTGGDTDNDGDIDQVISLGGRSVSIFNAASITLVADTASVMEQQISSLMPDFYNSDSKFGDRTLAATFDSRSDNRGPEPKSVAMFSTCKDKYLVVVVGLEMPGGVMVFTVDLRDPSAGFKFQTLEMPITDYELTDTWSSLWMNETASLLRVEDLTIYEARSPILLTASAHGSSAEAYKVRVKCSG